jgi:hypothetical protein
LTTSPDSAAAIASLICSNGNVFTSLPNGNLPARWHYNEIDSSVWAGGQAFKLAADRAKLTPNSTPADVLRGLYTFKNETVDGLTPPLTYVKGKPSLVPRWFTQQIKSGKFVPVTPGGKLHCTPRVTWASCSSS